MSIKDFKGQVKVADVQAAFDEVVGNINSLVSTYNVQSEVENIDYTVGGANLAPSGYTLTVGGLKQFINAAEGCVVGGKPFRVDDNHFKMSTGMLVARNGIFKLPDKVLTIPTSNEYRTVYYNPYTLDYQWTGKGTISYVVEKEVTIGSNLYQCCEEDPNLYALNSNAYNDISLGDRSSSGSYYYQHWKGWVFYKHYYDYPSTEVLTDSIKLRINDIPTIILEDDTLKNDDSIIINWKSGSRGSSYGSIKYGESYYDQFTPNFCLGTLDTDGVTFTPKLYLAAYTSYPNGNSCNLAVYTPTDVELHENIVTSTSRRYYNINAKANWNPDSNGRFSTDQYVNWGHGDSKSMFKFIHNNETDKDELEVYQYENGQPVYKFSITIPESLSSYGINCIFPNVTCNALEDDRIYSTTQEALGSQASFDINCVKVNASGKTFGINTDSRKVIIKELVIEESDTAAYRICDINPNSTSKFIGVNTNVQCERINGTYKITNQTVNYEDHWVKADLASTTGGSYEKSPWYQVLDTSKDPKFVNMMPSMKRATSKHGSGTDCEVFLFGEEVYLNSGQKRRAVQMWCPATYLFIPKGVKNPYTAYHPVGSSGSTDLKYSSQKVLNVTITKQIEDSSG